MPGPKVALSLGIVIGIVVLEALAYLSPAILSSLPAQVREPIDMLLKPLKETVTTTMTRIVTSIYTATKTVTTTATPAVGTPATTTVTVGGKTTVTVTKLATITVEKVVEKTVTLWKTTTTTVTKTSYTTTPYVVTVTTTVTVTPTPTPATTTPATTPAPTPQATLAAKLLAGELEAFDEWARARGDPVELVAEENWLIVYVSGLAYEVTVHPPGGGPALLVVTPEPARVPGKKHVTANATLASRDYTILLIDASTLLRILGEGEYLLVIWTSYTPTSKPVETARCKITLEPGGAKTGSCKLVRSPLYLDCTMISPTDSSSDDPISWLCYLTPWSLDQVERVVYGGVPPSYKAEAVWKALEWVSEKISYDWEKQETRRPGTLSPVEMLRVRRGVCRDYTMFLVAALLSAGVKPVYAIWIPGLNHTTAVVEVRGSLVVLDQKLPPVELGDYEEYIIGHRLGKVIVAAYTLKEGLPLVLVQSKILEPTDTYPADDEDELSGMVRKVLESERPELKPEPRLRMFIETGVKVAMYKLYSPTLAGVTAKRVPLMKLYSPIFAWQWARMLAKVAERVLPETLGTLYYWLEVNTTGIAVTYVDYELPDVRTYTSGLELVIEVSSRKSIESITVAFYVANKTQPVLAVAPPGASYKGVDSITATQWSIEGGKAVIAFNIEEAKKKLNEKGIARAVMVVWIGNKMVYAAWFP